MKSTPEAPEAPPAVAYVRDLLRGFGRPWVLCGGWAADAWLGRQTRPHFDVDIAVFHHDQREIFDHFPGWALVGHDPNVPDDTSEPWNGRHLDMPAHIHAPMLGTTLSTVPEATHGAFEFEFLLSETSGGDWVLHRQPDVTLPLESAILKSPWGLPTASPEVVLFFKSENVPARRQDEDDFAAVLPILTDAQRTWLHDSIGRVHPGHPWLARC